MATVLAATSQAWLRASRLTLALAIIASLAEILAGPGYRFGWWNLGVGLTTMRTSATASAVLLVLAIGGIVLARLRQGLGSRTQALFFSAALVSSLATIPPGIFWYRSHGLPRIHDITTDMDHPPAFVAVLPLRKGARNSTVYDPATAVQQKSGYADIAPVELRAAPARAFEASARIARSMGWEVAAVVPDDMRLEATATSLLFGFKDDISIRITPHGEGSRVDIRSLSRVGGSDFGTNANRIRAFIKELDDENLQ